MVKYGFQLLSSMKILKKWSGNKRISDISIQGSPPQNHEVPFGKAIFKLIKYCRTGGKYKTHLKLSCFNIAEDLVKLRT